MTLEPMPQEDIETPEIPELVSMLLEMQILGLSIDRMIGEDRLVHVTPTPTLEMADRIREHFEELEHLLPGACDGCATWVIRRYEAWWAARPHFCTRCHHLVVAHLERTGEWPAADFGFEEEQ